MRDRYSPSPHLACAMHTATNSAPASACFHFTGVLGTKRYSSVRPNVISRNCTVSSARFTPPPMSGSQPREAVST